MHARVQFTVIHLHPSDGPTETYLFNHGSVNHLHAPTFKF